MLIKSFYPRVQIWFNSSRHNRYLHKTTLLWQTKVQQSRDDLTEKDKEILPHEVAKDPVPQKLLQRIRVEYHGVECTVFNDETIWIPIYRFPYIGMSRSVIRFKVYLSIISIVACLRSVSNLLETLDTNLLPASILTTISAIGMYLAGNLFRRLIAQVYISEDSEYLRFCRFTFFGKRLDMVLPLTAVIPLSETNVSGREFYMKVFTKKPDNFSSDYDYHEFYDENFRLILRFGGILDMQRFEKAFGKVLRPKVN